MPKEAILDTGATKVMLSQTFASATQINSNNLNRGVEYVTASGAVEMPLGVSRGKVKFSVSRGTPHMHTIWLFVTIVDTTTYDVLLDMEFMTAMGGATTHTRRHSSIAGRGATGWRTYTRYRPLATRQLPLSSLTLDSVDYWTEKPIYKMCKMPMTRSYQPRRTLDFILLPSSWRQSTFNISQRRATEQSR